MRTLIMACRTVENELLMAMKQAGVNYPVLFLEAGLHLWPDKLREAARVYLLGDYATAASLWRPLADQGDAMAQTNLGILYAKGQGVKQDFVRAYMWLSLAGGYGGGGDAARYRDIVASHMTPSQIADAQRQAQSWERR